MNKFVVITKTCADIRSEENKIYPDEWPAECEEFETMEQARAKYPTQPLFTIADYTLFSQGLALAHKLMPKPEVEKPWWAFWRKRNV